MNHEKILRRKIHFKGQHLKLIQAESRKFIQKASAIPLRTVIKEILIDMYSKGIMPKEVTQKLYDFLKLKEM